MKLKIRRLQRNDQQLRDKVGLKLDRAMVANVVIKAKGSDTALFAAEQSVADFLILAELNLHI